MTIQFSEETFRDDYPFFNSDWAIKRFPFPFHEGSYMYLVNMEQHRGGPEGSVYEMRFGVDAHYVSEMRDRAIARIGRHRRVRAGLKTALGTALNFGRLMLQQQEGCRQHTIDVSGDGRSNSGPVPAQVYGAGFDRTTVSVLVIGNPKVASGEGKGISQDALQRSFESSVIHGSGAFALVANGYADYARAMKEKLERELTPPVIGALGRVTRVPG